MEQQDKVSFGIFSAIIWVCVTVFYCYQYIIRIIPNVIFDYINSKYAINAAEFGSFAGIYYLGYIIVHIPIGIAMSRYLIKNILPFCIFLTAAGLLPIVYSDNWYLALFGRLISGIGSSAAIIGALQMYRLIYPERFSMMLGITVCCSLVTVVYAGSMFGTIITQIGLNYTINLLVGAGIGLAVLTYVLLPNDKKQAGQTNILTDIQGILCNYKLLLCSFFAGLLVGPLEGFADAWGSAFLMQVHNVDKVTADSITLSIFMGMCIGCIILPYIADKLNLHLGVTIGASIVSILCFAYLLTGQLSVMWLYGLALTIGVTCAYQVVIIPKITTFVEQAKNGLAGSVVNMIIMMFGWVFHKSIGLVIDNNWSGDTNAMGQKIYSSSEFIAGIWVIPGAAIFAVMGLVLIASNILSQEIKKPD